LAPTNGGEAVAWIFLCIIAGVVEEMIFRGYLQRQFIAWTRGTVAAGVAFSALLFGAAHGYQGVRNMVLLAVFGVLFSLLALFRRSLRAGIIAHSWHDLFAGLVLAFLKAHHKL
jgi:membrane protease YdiL (CAAX protease family)